MSAERRPELVAENPRLPKDVYEQLAALPCEEEMGEIIGELALKVFSLLSNHGILIETGSMRAKSREKIEKKIERRGSTAPLRDIYGLRFITNEPDRAKIARILQSAFPLTPEKFPEGMPSVREYADSETRNFVKSNFNPRISERHSAMHVNIVFAREGKALLEIAEVQILSEDELKIFRETRGEYENGKH